MQLAKAETMGMHEPTYLRDIKANRLARQLHRLQRAVYIFKHLVCSDRGRHAPLSCGCAIRDAINYHTLDLAGRQLRNPLKVGTKDLSVASRGEWREATRSNLHSRETTLTSGAPKAGREGKDISQMRLTKHIKGTKQQVDNKN